MQFLSRQVACVHCPGPCAGQARARLPVHTCSVLGSAAPRAPVPSWALTASLRSQHLAPLPTPAQPCACQLCSEPAGQGCLLEWVTQVTGAAGTKAQVPEAGVNTCSQHLLMPLKALWLRTPGKQWGDSVGFFKPLPITSFPTSASPVSLDAGASRPGQEGLLAAQACPQTRLSGACVGRRTCPWPTSSRCGTAASASRRPGRCAWSAACP